MKIEVEMEIDGGFTSEFKDATGKWGAPSAFYPNTSHIPAESFSELRRFGVLCGPASYNQSLDLGW